VILSIAGQVMHVSALPRMGTVTATWRVSTAAPAYIDTDFTVPLYPVRRPAPVRRSIVSPRDLGQGARLSQGLVPPPRRYDGPAARWRPLPVRLVPRVVRRQSRLA